MHYVGFIVTGRRGSVFSGR